MAEYKRQGSIDDENFLYLAEKGSEDSKSLSDNLNTCLVNVQTGIANGANEIKESLDSIKEALNGGSNSKYFYTIYNTSEGGVDFEIPPNSFTFYYPASLYLQDILNHFSNFIVSDKVFSLFKKKNLMFNAGIVTNLTDRENCVEMIFTFYNMEEKTYIYHLDEGTELFSFISDIDVDYMFDEAGINYIKKTEG